MLLLRRRFVSRDFDVAVIGSGFAGSLFAMLCRRIGRSVVLVEKGAHPRFAIGESSSPMANLLLEEIGRRYDLPRVVPLTAWGSWQRTYPEIVCGLKRGFTFYGHRDGRAFGRDPGRCDQLLVAASPHDEVADTHWYRADLDQFLVREAGREGVEYLDRTSLDRCETGPAGVRLRGERLGRPVAISARFLADASGPRGFLHCALGLPEGPFPDLPANEGLYSHFEGVRRVEELEDFAMAGTPPYPPDDAALHHVFEGGWIWVLRFANGITSAGVAAKPSLARRVALEQGESAWSRLLSRLPSVAAQFEKARAVRPFVHAPRLPFRSGAAAGGRWALLPSAAAFVDPLLSTGIPLALLGIQKLAGILEREWDKPGLEAALVTYAETALADADAAALLIAALYASLDDFELFSRLSLLYFAAASFAEAARRLGRPELGGSFLSRDHPAFGPALRGACQAALDHRAREAGRARLERAIDEAVAILDVAGLGDASRRNWHPVDAQPLYDGAWKLGATRVQIERTLKETGFFVADPPEGVSFSVAAPRAGRPRPSRGASGPPTDSRRSAS